MRYPPGSYVDLYQRQRRFPNSLCLWTDPELSTLLQHARNEINPDLIADQIAEGLVRVWLFGSKTPEELLETLDNLCPAAVAYFCGHPQGPLPDENLIKVEDLSPTIRDALVRQLKKRIRQFNDAHGILAIVREAASPGAVPIPFRLYCGETRPGLIRDAANREISRWSEQAENDFSWLPVPPPRTVLSVEIPEQHFAPEGSSFGVPVLAAHYRRRGLLPDYNPLKFLCTGALNAAGAIEPVSGCREKQALAERLGAALFCAPASEALASSSNGLFFSPGQHWEDCVQEIGNALDAKGIGQLSPRQANRRLPDLHLQIRQGQVCFDEADKRLKRYEKVFQSTPESPNSQEGLLACGLLRAALANHAGQSEAARKMTGRLLQSASAQNDPEKMADAMAQQVVALTDLGLIEEAERLGRELLQFSEDCKGGASTRLEVRMKACGVTGGQPLLQKGLFQPEARHESLSLLHEALECALELENQKEIAFDLTQLLLWQALFKPEEIGEKIHEIQARLLEMGPDAQLSLEFTRLYQHLASYRIFLAGNPLPSRASDDPLPVSHSTSWVHALAKKYRGTAWAHQSEPEMARDDFESGYAILSGAPSPLLRFFGATLALQAGESLHQDSEYRKLWLKRALSDFQTTTPYLEGLQKSPGWIRRAEGLMNGENTETLPHPQLKYRY